MMHQPRRQQLTADLWAKAGELEKQFASYKKKVERSDQARDDESASREKREQVRKDGGRGELYERYMRIRDAKLREQSSLRMERRGTEMAAMLDKLERSRAELAARFAGAGTAGPVQTPSPSVSKKTVQVP